MGNLFRSIFHGPGSLLGDSNHAITVYFLIILIGILNLSSFGLSIYFYIDYKKMSEKDKLIRSKQHKLMIFNIVANSIMVLLCAILFLTKTFNRSCPYGVPCYQGYGYNRF